MPAFGAETILARRSDVGPDRGILRHVGDLALVAARRCAHEGLDPLHIADVGARRERRLRRRPRQMMVADIVAAALEQGNGDRDAQRIAHQRQVALIELVLQRLGPGGNDHLAAGKQGGNQIGEGLAGAGPGFGEQLAARLDGERDRLGHRDLLRPRPVAGNIARKRSVGVENRTELGVAQRRPLSASALARRDRPLRRRVITAKPIFSWLRRLCCRLGGGDRRRFAQRLDLLLERAVRMGDALLVTGVDFVRPRCQLGKALGPGRVQCLQPLHLRLVAPGLAQRRLVGARDQTLVLFDAALGLGAVDALLRAGQPEFDDLDALDLAAHRVGMRNRLEKAVDAAALERRRADVWIDVVEGVHRCWPATRALTASRASNANRRMMDRPVRRSSMLPSAAARSSAAAGNAPDQIVAPPETSMTAPLM